MCVCVYLHTFGFFLGFLKNNVSLEHLQFGLTRGIRCSPSAVTAATETPLEPWETLMEWKQRGRALGLKWLLALSHTGLNQTSPALQACSHLPRTLGRIASIGTFGSWKDSEENVSSRKEVLHKSHRSWSPLPPPSLPFPMYSLQKVMCSSEATKQPEQPDGFGGRPNFKQQGKQH